MLFGFVIGISLLSGVKSTFYLQQEIPTPCNCYCPDDLASGMSLCNRMSAFEKEFYSTKLEVERRTRYITELNDLKQRMDMQEEQFRKLELKVQTMESQNLQPLPTSMAFEKETPEGDNPRTKNVINAEELVRNITSLVAKLEKVKDVTSKIQEELMSEKRVRRYLEEDLNRTHSIIKSLDNNLQTVTLPMLINLNRTLNAEQILKLYHQIEGVAYRNETKKLEGRLNVVESKMSNIGNYSLLQKLEEEHQTFNEILRSFQNEDGLLKNQITSLADDLQEIRNYTINFEGVIVDQIERNMFLMEPIPRGFTPQRSQIRSSFSNDNEPLSPCELRKRFRVFNPDRIQAGYDISGPGMERCTLPIPTDEHLHVAIEYVNEQQQLLFWCKPIGKYRHYFYFNHLDCVEGSWNGSLPSCVPLMDESEVENTAIQVRNRDPCKLYEADIADPLDCSYFFRCSMGRSERLRCFGNTSFDAVSGRCKSSYMSTCATSSPDYELLRNIVPTILVDPDVTHETYEKITTSGKGELIVYPGTIFGLRCLFPDSKWGLPAWYYTNLSSKFPRQLWHRKEMNSIVTLKRYFIDVDSGVYSCHTPFGTLNEITVLVRENMPDTNDDDEC